MTQFDTRDAHYDPKAFPTSLRAVSLVLSGALVAVIVFFAASTAAFFA